MTYREYNLNGRKMLNLDNLGMVDYDEYYLISSKSYERRSNIVDKYVSIQKANMIENEPNINNSILYDEFLDKLKDVNSEMYNKKLQFYKQYIKELSEEEKIFNEEKKQLLSKGYPFDNNLRKHGYYIIKIDNEYFQYKRTQEKNLKIDMGDNLLRQNAYISSYEFVPITQEELEQIKMQDEEYYAPKGFK